MVTTMGLVYVIQVLKLKLPQAREQTVGICARVFA